MMAERPREAISAFLASLRASTQLQPYLLALAGAFETWQKQLQDVSPPSDPTQASFLDAVTGISRLAHISAQKTSRHGTFPPDILDQDAVSPVRTQAAAPEFQSTSMITPTLETIRTWVDCVDFTAAEAAQLVALCTYAVANKSDQPDGVDAGPSVRAL